MRESDAQTIARAVPSLELMRRAALGIYRIVELKHGFGDSVVIAIGSGNNGGDGFALAEILLDSGISPVVLTVTDHYSDDSTHYMNKFLSKGGKMTTDADVLSGAGVIVDCLLGTGFKGEPKGLYKEAIVKINESGAYVVSADINSGMNGDTGEYSVAVKSDLTVTIGYLKTGLIIDYKKSDRIISDIAVAEIGIDLVHRENLVVSSDEDINRQVLELYGSVFYLPEKILCLEVR